ncbi:MAG: DUF3086 domain-containing protein [Pseudanabaenaceae cyanobacterium SKYGB_i_bin29]|nr:DUF3086 domain-containing protein [Pseudanabaenaceae cyanobacterium SKYG29]MDW8421273.1 DUF3086 domain-containing protein [Pseudanabaenaceae cyanobacterium SKYGB_i_bin29]
MSQDVPLGENPELEELQRTIANLRGEIAHLQTQKAQLLEDLPRVLQDSLGVYEQRKQELQDQITVLQRKLERIQQEMKTTYAGVSQDIAVRVQGFRDYLVGSLQDLVTSVEKLPLLPAPAPTVVETPAPKPPETPPLTEEVFADYKEKITQLLDRYRTMPDYYGPAWKLRRTFEKVHSDRVADWFFKLAGRGAVPSLGTRLQNVLVASAATSVLRVLYGNKVKLLILATSPERLGEWRRGLQDCLGINRDAFGPDRGVTLFEDAEPLVDKGEKMLKENLMPFVIVDESEEFIAVEMLKFPLLMCFARDRNAKPAFRDFDF